MVKNRLYENGVIIAPSCEHSFFDAYREEFPEQDFRVFTIEEVEELFYLSMNEKAPSFLREKGYAEEDISAMIEILKRTQIKAYKNAKLNSFCDLLQEMMALGIAKRKEGVGEIFAGKSIVVRLYTDGLRLAKALESLPNICVSWDIRPKENGEPMPIRWVKESNEQDEIARKLIAEHPGEDLVLFGGDEHFGLPMLNEPFAPTGKTVLVLNAQSSLGFHDYPFAYLLTLEERQELGLVSLRERKRLHDASIASFLRQRNILKAIGIHD